MVLLCFCAILVVEAAFMSIRSRALISYSCFLVQWEYSFYRESRTAWAIRHTCGCFCRVIPSCSLPRVSFEGAAMRPLFCNWYMCNCYSTHEAQACPLAGVMGFLVAG